jgi:hypothetical protein
MVRLSQGDLRPAETHRNPGGDQLQHELAGVTATIGQVIGKRDADAALLCHDPHFKWRRACRKAVPEHRQPVPFGEVEEHRRIATRGEDSSGSGTRLEPTLFEMLLPNHALHAILSIEDKGCSTIGIEHRRRRSHLLEPTSGFLATRAIAGTGQNRRANGLELHFAASAGREKALVLLLVHCVFPILGPRLEDHSVGGAQRPQAVIGYRVALATRLRCRAPAARPRHRFAPSPPPLYRERRFAGTIGEIAWQFWS